MHTRRQFVGISLAAAAALQAAPLNMPIGFQVWPVREPLLKDFAGTLKKMAGEGFQAAEMCSPPGYGWEALTPMKAGEMKKIIKDAGLACKSCHYQFLELKENLEQRAEFARGVGIEQMVVASFGLRREATMAEWQRAAEEMNPLGERAKKAGMTLAFHNHHGEFEKIDGVLIYDVLLKAMDPKLVKMQFQVAVANIGYHAADYIEKYPGRIISLHLADWSESEKKTVAVGQGLVDWKRLFAVAKKGGVKNYFVEMDEPLMGASVPYLRDLQA